MGLGLLRSWANGDKGGSLAVWPILGARISCFWGEPYMFRHGFVLSGIFSWAIFHPGFCVYIHPWVIPLLYPVASTQQVANKPLLKWIETEDFIHIWPILPSSCQSAPLGSPPPNLEPVTEDLPYTGLLSGPCQEDLPLCPKLPDRSTLENSGQVGDGRVPAWGPSEHHHLSGGSLPTWASQIGELLQPKHHSLLQPMSHHLGPTTGLPPWVHPQYTISICITNPIPMV